MKYAVLEAFSSAVVFGKMSIRASFMSELLGMLNQSRYQAAMEQLLQSQKDGNAAERVLRLYEVETIIAGVRLTRVLVISSFGIVVVDKPKPNNDCQVCPPEKFCPHAPRPERKMSYNDLARLVKGYGSQMFTIGWIDPSGTETFENIVCHKARDRDSLLETLHTLSGAGTGSLHLQDRCSMFFDTIMREVIQEIVKDDYIFALTFAMRQDQNRLSLFMLTNMKVYEFKVNFEAWGLDASTDFAGDADDEIGPVLTDLHDEDVSLVQLPPDHGSRAGKNYDKSKFKIAGDQEEEMSAAAQAKYLIQKDIKHRREAAKAQGESERLEAVNKGMFGDKGLSPQQKRDAMIENIKSGLLTPLCEADVGSLTQIAFQPGETPILRLDLGETMMIEFYDDLAREDWRKALSCALNSPDAASPWARGWANPSEM